MTHQIETSKSLEELAEAIETFLSDGGTVGDLGPMMPLPTFADAIDLESDVDAFDREGIVSFDDDSYLVLDRDGTVRLEDRL